MTIVPSSSCGEAATPLGGMHKRSLRVMDWMMELHPFSQGHIRGLQFNAWPFCSDLSCEPDGLIPGYSVVRLCVLPSVATFGPAY